MATKRDYYEILQVSKSATLEQIKKAYREAALRYHPDRVPEKEKKASEEKFKEISEAYAILSDPDKRAIYDQQGHAGVDQKYAHEDIFRGTDFSSIFQDLGDYGLSEGFFDQIFGDRGFDVFGERHREKMHRGRGRDLQITLSLTLEDVAEGREKTLSFRRYDPCTLCQGSGVKVSGKRKLCSHCHGSGQEVASSGRMRMIRPCRHCNGTGKEVDICAECQGKGQVAHVRELTVTIPAGINNGAQLRIPQEGEKGVEGRGNLYLTIQVQPHSHFERRGNDLITQITIPLTIAVLGGEVSVPTLAGNVSMKVPSGTQNGTHFRLKGKGIASLNQKIKGDELVKVTVEIPKTLSPEQRKIMEAFAKSQQVA